MELVFLLIFVITIFSIFSLFRLYDVKGLYLSLVLLLMVSYISSFKIINVFNFDINIGLIILTQVFTCIYIIISKYGKKEIKKIIKYTSFTIITTALFIITTCMYIPIEVNNYSVDFFNTFIINYKLLILFPILVIISEYSTVKIYVFLEKYFKNIILSVMLTFIINAVIYIIILLNLSYIKLLPIVNSILISLSTYIIGLLITFCSVAIINYIIKYKKVVE